MIGSAGLMALVPIAISDSVLSRHALSQGRDETRAMAERTVERVDAVVGEGLGALAALRKDGHSGCGWDDRMAYGNAAFRSSFIQQIGIADGGGTLLCGEPMGSLASPARLPAADPGDPSVMIGVLAGGAGTPGQAVVTLRVDDSHRLVARFSVGSLAIETGPAYFRDASSVGVFLEDGSIWHVAGGDWKPATEADAIAETMSSSRYPVKVVATTSAGAALQTIAPLRIMIVILATLTGIGFFAVSLWNAWRREEGDSFSRAVENAEFIPYYQPLFDLFTGEIRGCEVLVRWRRPNGSMVPPGQFLPYAEATGHIREITRQLMMQTVEDLSEFYGRHPTLKLSINLTAMHFNDLDILDEIRETYGESGIRFEQLCFEVTEQHPLKDLTLSRAIIGRIQALGASVALDDVGTGHGGLAYLQKLGVDIIKIDKMFIDNIGTDHSSQTIVDTLVELANQLGLGIIAEGVERQDQIDHLKRIGVATAQGYAFSPPVGAADYIAICRKALAAASPAPETAAADTEAHRDAA